MSNPEIIDLTIDTPYMDTVFEVYKKRFADPPWSEVSKCEEDGYYSLPVGILCPKCDNRLGEAYPKESTIAKISSELEIFGAVGKLAIIDGVVAAFNWGFRSNPRLLASSKWDDCSKDMQKSVITALSPYAQKLQAIFYLSECVTAVDYENQKLQKKLVTAIKQEVDLAIPWIVRTNAQQTAMVRICENDLGLTRVINVGDDSGSQNRVLYAGFVSY